MIDGAYKLERELLLVPNLRVVLDLHETAKETVE
jgi:hypothetical protein